MALSEKPLTDQAGSDALIKLLHKTIKKVGEDTASLNFNTAISQMMICINELNKQDSLPRTLWENFVKLLAPYAPHLAEELWEKLGYTNSIAHESWPVYDEKLCIDSVCTIVVQINGKLRDKFETPIDTDKSDLEAQALNTEGAKRFIANKTVKKIIVVPNKLVNIVVA
ncbi:class I tRNA ligase family protein [Treponema phagedenis]|uniref:class I tRNA ligase family protein n=1 Tax=Treponema phagedenis TaxID=162 RepID=UPI00292A3F78|nr:class I tRNA ligase family protein [Treponema phagedenis]